MSTAGLLTMLVVWTVVIITVSYFFQKVIRTPQHSDEDEKEQPSSQ
jgi:uncharacterized protein HemY